MQIDAEIYFWKYVKTISQPVIRKNKLLQQHYLPEQIAQSLYRNEIDGCIAVIAEPAELETRFLSELAVTHPVIRGVVGWIDLYDPKAVEKIQSFQMYSAIRGYKVEIWNQNQPAPAVMEILREYEYSLDISVSSEMKPPDLERWLNTYPDQPFILADCGNPDAKQTPSGIWEKTIRDLSKNQNLSCKVSGLFERSNLKSWKPADFYPFLEILFESFGPERLLYASDWPFILLSGMYVQWKSLLEKFTETFNPGDREKFFGENAARIYRI